MNGFENEKIIVETINNNDFSNLSTDFQNAIIKINSGTIPKTLSAKQYGGTDKADLSIVSDGKVNYVSVKKGSGNSIHQEPIERFIKFLAKEIEYNSAVFNDLRHFIWGDGTLDGSGKVEDRIGAAEYKKTFPNKINNIQIYFNRHKQQLLERFIINGAVTTSHNVDYLFYGNTDECTVVSKPYLLDFALNVKKRPLSIGVLTFQAWNRNINGGNKSENKRGQIQLKWGSLRKDVETI